MVRKNMVEISDTLKFDIYDDDSSSNRAAFETDKMFEKSDKS